MKIANAQNNTFASSDTRTDASACKRVVFLTTLPCTPTTLENSLTINVKRGTLLKLKLYFSKLINRLLDI